MSNAIVFVVDDEPAILATTSRILAPHYTVRAAITGARAVEATRKRPQPDLILLDVMMADMDGYTVLSKLKEHPATRNIPVIFVTGLKAFEEEAKGLAMGAADYIAKPIVPAILLARVAAQIALKQSRDFLFDKNAFLEAEVARRMEANQVVQNVCIRALAHLAETRDPETGDHILRTQSYVRLLAERLQGHRRFRGIVTNDFVGLVTRSAPLHDIGKVGIPDHVLLKPGKLTDDEWEIMKTHAELGAHAIEQAQRDAARPVEFLDLAREIAHWHHEKWDGSGYPDGLAEDSIPVSARLMAIADVFDALISKRVYKDAISAREAREIIADGRGAHFDPDITDTFLDAFEEFELIAHRRGGRHADSHRLADGVAMRAV